MLTRNKQDFSSINVLNRYQEWRRFDNQTLGFATDNLNKIFSSYNPLFGSLKNLGMKYYKVPMTFDSLNSNVLSDFFDRLEKLSERKILVHCHHNIRVSVLLAFYRIIKLNWEKDKAFAELGKMVDLNSMWDDYFTFHINNYQASQSS